MWSVAVTTGVGVGRPADSAVVICSCTFQMLLILLTIMANEQAAVYVSARPTAVGSSLSRSRYHSAVSVLTAQTGTGNSNRRQDLTGGITVVDSSANTIPWTSHRQTNHVTQCITTNGQCFTSASCCRGLVCADFNDFQPEQPGYCVREKELQFCTDDGQCSVGCQCIQLSRGHSYCLSTSRPVANFIATFQDPTGHLTSGYTRGHARRLYPEVGVDGGLGSSCMNSSNCNPTTDDGTRRLCCQLVRRGFQQPRRMCDRVTAVSVCLGSAPLIAPD